MKKKKRKKERGCIKELHSHIWYKTKKLKFSISDSLIKFKYLIASINRHK